MKPRISDETKFGFAARLKQVLDSKGFPSTGRVSRLSEKFGVTPSAASAWLKGSIPSVDTVLLICEEFGIKPNWLLTGRDDSSFELDSQRMMAAVKVVNHHARQMKLLQDLSDEKLARLYALTYQRMAAGGLSDSDMHEMILLAAPKVE